MTPGVGFDYIGSASTQRARPQMTRFLGIFAISALAPYGGPVPAEGRAMSAALSYPRVLVSSPVAVPTPAAIIPPELAVLFEESSKARSTFYLLKEQDRVGFVKFIDLATTTVARERRAAIVATSLIGLAACFANGSMSS